MELAPVGGRCFSVGAAALVAADMQVVWIDPSDGDLVNQERVVSQGGELPEVDAMPMMLHDDASAVAALVVEEDVDAVAVVRRVDSVRRPWRGEHATTDKDAVHGGAAKCREDEQRDGPAQESLDDLLGCGHVAKGYFVASPKPCSHTSQKARCMRHPADD